MVVLPRVSPLYTDPRSAPPGFFTVSAHAWAVASSCPLGCRSAAPECIGTETGEAWSEKDYSENMKTTITLCVAVLVSAVAVAGQAPDAYEPPRTAAGHPDLHGVWNFSSNVSMQRAQRFGDREFMTAEEVAQLRARLAAARNCDVVSPYTMCSCCSSIM